MDDLEKTLNLLGETIRANRFYEYVLIGLIITLFASGIACFWVAMLSGNIVLAAPPLLTTAILQWPILRLQGMRKDNMLVQTIPILVQILPPHDAAEEIRALIAYFIGKDTKRR